MLTLQVQHSSFICPNDKIRSFRNVFVKNGGGLVTVVSKRRDLPEKANEKRPFLQIKVPNTILARSAIAVLGLGFIDAGYSGDWSRIGVLSKETEELLKLAAFLVVPLCIVLGLSFSDESSD
ncbi:unnamed protein product [Brassica napus]|uniref:DUF7887 domain-containing protein n=3 Tax=Brassica TaxID=3705 RepID=A0ABQ7E2X8_BRACR|nr:hypothetical protein DY000_02027671 [Brassica cretica]CAF2030744.1 unnamed protein product [Brassica napus]VDD40723.1 unnamed protein product [Brassica oleracea]